MDGDDNILVVDSNNHRIQNFTPCRWEIYRSSGKGREQAFGVQSTFGYCDPYPLNNKVYIFDNRNNRIQILNTDLTFSSTLAALAMMIDNSKVPGM